MWVRATCKSPKILGVRADFRECIIGYSICHRFHLAGLNSTPVLIGAFIVITCLQALGVSYKRSVTYRDEKGKVSWMRHMGVDIGGRAAAALAGAYSALAGFVKLSGGSG